MPSNSPAGGVNAVEIDQKLRRSYFVKRGDIMKAFGLSRADMEALVPDTFTPAPLPAARDGGKTPRYKTSRARFVRSQVMTVARQWDRGAA